MPKSEKNDLKVDLSWHLAQEEDEAELADFEFALWRVVHSFMRWQEDCQHYICGNDLTANEIAILHVIRMNDRDKTIHEICRLLNRDDQNNVFYSIKKLTKLKLVTSKGSKKNTTYEITNQGMENTTAYRNAKLDVLLKVLEVYCGEETLENTKIILIKLKGVYDEASRLVSTYTPK